MSDPRMTKAVAHAILAAEANGVTIRTWDVEEVVDDMADYDADIERLVEELGRDELVKSVQQILGRDK